MQAVSTMERLWESVSAGVKKVIRDIGDTNKRESLLLEASWPISIIGVDPRAGWC
jgi:hypothetical protein